MKSNHQTKWIRILAAPLMAIAILAPAPHSAVAQAQAPQKATSELEQLKDRLQQVETVMRELKGQINAMEQAQKPPGGTVTQAPTQASAPAAIEQRGPEPSPAVNRIPAQPDGPVAAVKTTTNTTQEKVNTFEAYGYVMLDSGYQFNQNQSDWFDVVRPTKLPSFKDEFGPDGKVFFGTRQTRFGVKSSTPTKYGDLKTQFEFELFGTGVDAGQTTFRLRHAYGELGQFGAGQTWSPFMDIDVFPNSLEYWGPNGMVFFRNVQVRWMPIKGDSRVTIALERPGASGDQGVFQDRNELQGIRGKFDLPDLSGEARLGRSWGYVEIAGMLRRIKWVDTINDQVDLSGSDVGWGLNFSSNLKFGKKDIGRFQVVYGEGIENYMNDAPVDIGIRTNFSDPVRPIEGVALPVLGIVAFLDHTWNERFTSSVGYSMLDIENSNGQSPNAFNRGQYALTNVLFSPVPNAMVGAEFQWGRRTNFSDGFSVNDFRMQFSFKYNFSKLFTF